jgi:hypothetical protein
MNAQGKQVGVYQRHNKMGMVQPSQQGVAEAGPFSYGKPPRKGSVADLAAKKRKEQERGQQPIEPKDQQVGVAKVTKGVAEGNKKPEPPEADYGDEYQAMVKRVGKLAKEGPRKTVWDPVKRVYKTVPVNTPKEQGVAENIVAGIIGHEIKKFLDEPTPKEKAAGSSSPGVKDIIKKISMSNAAPDHKKAAIDAIMAKYGNQDITEEQVDENLRNWFKDKWVRFGPDGKIRGDCARGDDSEGKPKCLPQSKAQALGKKGRASAAAKKRREDPNPERSGKAINVSTKTNEAAQAKLSAETVRRIQNFLNDKFDANLDVDGILGPLTIKSIKDDQHRIQKEKDDLRALVLTLTREVAELRVKVEFLTDENGKLTRATKKKQILND